MVVGKRSVTVVDSLWYSEDWEMTHIIFTKFPTLTLMSIIIENLTTKQLTYPYHPPVYIWRMGWMFTKPSYCITEIQNVLCNFFYSLGYFPLDITDLGVSERPRIISPRPGNLHSINYTEPRLK